MDQKRKHDLEAASLIAQAALEVAETEEEKQMFREELAAIQKAKELERQKKQPN